MIYIRTNKENDEYTIFLYGKRKRQNVMFGGYKNNNYFRTETHFLTWHATQELRRRD